MAPSPYSENEEGAQASSSSVSQESHQIELDPSDVNEIIRALKIAEAPSIIILDDFHYLPEETQLDFAIALKAFHEASDFTFIIIGVWKDENRLIQHNGDLIGRVLSINADTWQIEDLNQVIDKGENLLNISFSPEFRKTIIDKSKGNIWLVQEACRSACQENSILERQKDHIVIEADADKIFENIVSQQNSRYNAFISNMCAGFQETGLQMHGWILWSLVNLLKKSDKKDFPKSKIREFINESHPRGEINSGNLTNALTSIANLQIQKKTKPIVLDFNQSSNSINITDDSFIIWVSIHNIEDIKEKFEITF